MRDSLIGVCPCKDCTDRTSTCHGNCEEYLEWSKKNETIREEEAKIRSHIFMTHKIGHTLKYIRKQYNQFHKE